MSIVSKEDLLNKQTKQKIPWNPLPVVCLSVPVQDVLLPAHRRFTTK